jgi:hypothetical protein
MIICSNDRVFEREGDSIGTLRRGGDGQRRREHRAGVKNRDGPRVTSRSRNNAFTHSADRVGTAHVSARALRTHTSSAPGPRVGREWPRVESNHRSQLRRLPLCPLSYGAATARTVEGGGRDSNPRPPGPQPGALPTELPPPRAHIVSASSSGTVRSGELSARARAARRAPPGGGAPRRSAEPARPRPCFSSPPPPRTASR